MIRQRQGIEEELRAKGEKIAMWGPSPGFRGLKWPKPVMAGDTLWFRITIADKLDLKSRPERGMLIFIDGMTNQKGELAAQVTGQILVPRRSPMSAGV